MTQYERMAKGLIYDPGDEEIVKEQGPCMDRVAAFNRIRSTDFKAKAEMMKEMFAECGEMCYFETPFYANWGGAHVHLGNNVYANYNLTLVDDGHIYIGDRVLFGPNVTVATAAHPVEPGLRSRNMQFNRDVHIGENAWIGAGAVILPGVHIGRNTVIGAGSVVTKDIPDNVVAVGNPCRVLREIGEKDREYFYKDEKIDWENLKEYEE